jgi:glycosyltransferase involved in cell wall biosynthesis
VRIAQVVETLNVGGLERLVVDLAIFQKQRGHEVRIFCLFSGGLLAQEAETYRVPCTVFGKQPGFSFRLLASLTRAFREWTPDVVHTHNPFVHHYAAAAATIARVRSVVNTRHGPASSNGLAYRERYFKMVLPMTDKVVFVSDDSCRVLVPKLKLPEHKSAVIRNGIPVAKFQASIPRSSGRNRIRFGTVGRLVPVKGHAQLLRAFSKVLPRIDAELVILGGGPLECELQAMIEELGLAGSVEIRKPTIDVASTLKEIDVFVLSSLSEGLPLVVLEAMSAGLPIVSTRVGGVPEIAPEGDVAWYSAPGDVDGLAANLELAAKSTELSIKGANASRIAADDYDISVMNNRYEELYLEILGRN